MTNLVPGKVQQPAAPSGAAHALDERVALREPWSPRAAWGSER